MRPYLLAAALLCTLLFAGAWRVLAPAFPAPERVTLDGSTMCGDPYDVRWMRVDDAVEYEVEYTGGQGDAGLFCKLTHPFDARACECDRYDDKLPAACFDGATRTTVTADHASLSMSGWSIHYRVRAVGASGARGAWSEIATSGCWIE